MWSEGTPFDFDSGTLGPLPTPLKIKSNCIVRDKKLYNFCISYLWIEVFI